MKLKFDCTILTQGMNEPATDFSKRITEQVNSIMDKTKNLYSVPFCSPTSDSRGRKEIFIQWSVIVQPKKKKGLVVVYGKKKKNGSSKTVQKVHKARLLGYNI